MTSSRLVFPVHVAAVVLWWCLLMMVLAQRCECSWWYLGLSQQQSAVTRDAECQSVSALLTAEQRTLCADVAGDVSTSSTRPAGTGRNLVEAVTSAASMAIDECEQQFSRSRWNCTTYNVTNVFGNVLSHNNREKAFIYAVTSAALMQSIMKACARGQISRCSCDVSVNVIVTTGFQWGGCSHDAEFGATFARQFTDGSSSSRSSISGDKMSVAKERALNAWNNRAGRKAVMQNMKLHCKCHGVSGSCSARICWRSSQSFRDVGHRLRAKYDGAGRVRYLLRHQHHDQEEDFDRPPLGRRRDVIRLRPAARRQKPPGHADLVYVDESPDFCRPDAAVGSLGTAGRQCNRTSRTTDGCALMCCGRGYWTAVEKREVEDCSCQFVWCCDVICEACTQTVINQYCN